MNSFTHLGLSSQTMELCEKGLVWFNPMEIQTEVIPLALQGRDVLAISPPRSGKSGAFVLPIAQALLEAGPRNINTLFACVLSLKKDQSDIMFVHHTANRFLGLGSEFGVKCVTLSEYYTLAHQSKLISQQPHIIVGSPRQILYHIRNTEGFSAALSTLKYLVIDDAHLLNDDSEQQLSDISEIIPRQRTTFLFSSKLTEKVHKIQSVCLRNPVKIDVSSKYSFVDTLQLHRCSMQATQKDCYLAYILAQMTGKKAMVFTGSCASTLFLALILMKLGFTAIPIILYMRQAKKLESLNAFKSGKCDILLCSDNASRGLDIPAVDVVIHHTIPIDPNDYMYSVGWTTHPDVAISFVSPDEKRRFNMIERLIGFPLPRYAVPCEDVLLLESRVSDAAKLAQKEIKEFGFKSGGYFEDEDVNKIPRFY